MQKQNKTINLSGRGLTKIPKEIFDQEDLVILNLGNNSISHIPPEIGKLINLRILILSKNQIREIPSAIGNLHDLRLLRLDGNQLSYLPKEMRFLQSLKKLNLSNNRFKKFPKVIRQLRNLKVLMFSKGDFPDLPSGIESLQKLSVLDFSFSKIRAIPPEISKIHNLETLNLSRNYIKDIPLELKKLTQLRILNLYKNPLPIPPEILENIEKPKAILDYFSSIRGNHYPLNEVKLLIVGQGSIGKTSLVNRIIKNTFSDSEAKTEGIAISQWHVEDRNRNISFINNSPNHQTKEQRTTIAVNIWDFGGQEIMHATHQFFLTKRSLYVLVLDSRLSQEENRVEYWLKVIQSFGGISPVLIVGNKIDQHPLDIDRTGLRKKYRNIIDILETSAATGKGIENLKETITRSVNRLRYVRDLLPESWFTVKTKLEELGKQSNFITHDQYLDLCAENEVSHEISQSTLIGFLHDLGVVLHFQDDPRLEALGILNPQWVTNGVYKILNSHTLFQNKGVLTLAMLNSILNIDGYPRDKRLFIVDMMKKFELCYDIEPDKSFLVPDLLPKDQPDLNFNGVPAFEYAYPVLPSSVITRFIVRMNQKIDDGFVWRTGVVLKIGENKALVKADIEDRKITIAIDGVEYSRRDALSAIRYELGEIHNSIKGLNPQQRVPVPNAPLAEPLKYEYLLKLERAGQETVLVENGNDLVTVNVRQMLSAIETEAQRREQQGNVINNYYTASDGGVVVGGNVTGNLISGNNNKIIQDSYNKIQSAEIDPELKQTLKSLTEAVATAVQSFPEEKTEKVVKNFERLADEVTQPEPDKQWYSVSIEGLIKAAENLDKLGTPVISLSRKVLSLLTGGVVK